MPTRTLTTGTSTQAGSRFETAAFTPLPGRLVVVFVTSAAQPLIGESITPTATSQQGEFFTLVATLKHPSAELTLTCFRALPTNAIGSGTLTFDFGGRGQRWCAWVVYEYDGVDPNGATVISDVTPVPVTAGNRLDTGLALDDKLCVAAIALDRLGGGLAPGVGSIEIDDVPIQAPFAAGELGTLERAADAGLPSVQWTWGADADAVAIAFALNPAPTPPDRVEVGPDERLIRRYEPILFLHPDEKFAPVDAKRYLEHCRLWSAFEKLWGGTGPRDIPRYWGQSPTNKEWPRIPNAQAGQLSGMANEPGTFLGDPQFDLLHYDFCLEMGGWRDETGVHESNVDVDTNNRYADGAEVARRYNDDADLGASKYWYHAEVFTEDRLTALLSTVKRPDLQSVFRDMALVDPVLLCYYLFFPHHDQHGPLQECTDSPRDQLVGSCGGDWACISLLLRRPDVGLDHVPYYIGLTGEQFGLNSDDDIWTGGPYGAHHFDDDDRINLNVYQWKPDLPNTTAGHPRIHVAPGSHSLSITAGNRLGAAFPSHAEPLHCGEFDSPSLMPGPDTPSAWETLAVVVAKILALGGIGFGAGVAEVASALMGPFPNPELGTPRPTQYPAAGTGLTIKPEGLDVPDEGPKVAWRSQNGLTLNNRRYDFIVDRAVQAWWPSDPDPYYPDDPIPRFRWGPPVEFDPLSRRAGMRFPDFWKMFFLGIADGQANKSFP
ncbi:hypothetical protein AFM11_14430 [Mycolicibacterium wolinskyi]|uniref:Uncharacterized protein n=1 Tax=Mycolicibacterium wolinskyi TaxID=59750 RepID=A0A132PMH9_9MYCO|nr:hypothetical protein [Mycolicibacterium wolinskyi]KWX23474.1 hypothetical protein AFM11_14430 [Mycolicibacterium wolinskyi]